MWGASLIDTIIRSDAPRWRLLALVRDLQLPDSWIGAGFIRDAIWDHLHGYPSSPPSGDIDVIWFDLVRVDPAEDRRCEHLLAAADPSFSWSVKNQARMHARNGDAPYSSVADAMRFWPETATAVAVRRDASDRLVISAPFGLSDLIDLRIRPTPRFVADKQDIYLRRLRDKGWTSRWPLLAEG